MGGGGVPAGPKLTLDGTTCLDTSGDRIYHDTDCDGTKDAGEEFVDNSPTGGQAVLLDIGDDSGNDSVDLAEIATTGDTNNIVTEPTADKMLIDMGQAWPTADALAANGANCSAGLAPLGVDTAGAVESCFDVVTAAELPITSTTPADGHLLLYDGVTDNQYENVAVSGDATITAAGVLTVTAISTCGGGSNTYMDSGGGCDDISTLYEAIGSNNIDPDRLNGDSVDDNLLDFAVLAALSSNADFLVSGALTCGASTQGKSQVHTTPLQYCDNAATPALQYAAYGDSSGNATGLTCTDCVGPTDIATDGVSADELNAGGVTAELEAVLTLSNLQGSVTDAQVPDTITASNYALLAGDTFTGEVIFDNLGVAFTDSDTNPTCAAGDYLVYADLSETTLKKCLNGVLSDLDTVGSGSLGSNLSSTTNDILSDVAVTGAIVLGGTGNTNNEAITLDFETAANTIGVSSTTSAATFAFGSMALNFGGGTLAGNIVMGDNSVTGVDTITFTDTAGTIALIENQNLVDKAAAEAITGAWDFGGATSLEMVNSATPTTNAAGEFALDTTITDHQPYIQYYSGSENMSIVALPTANLNANDNYILKYDATSDDWQMEVDATGGGAWSDADPIVQTDTTRDVAIGPAHINISKLSVDGDVTTVPAFSVQAVASPTESLVIVETSVGTEIFNIDNSGDVLAQSIQDIDGPGTNWSVTSAGVATFAGALSAASFTADPSTTPTLTLKDSDMGGTEDNNIQIVGNCPTGTTAGGNEDCDLDFIVQGGGAATTIMRIDTTDAGATTFQIGAPGTNYINIDEAGAMTAVSGATITATSMTTGNLSDVSVTATELSQLEAVGATTISAAQWATLGGLTSDATELNLLDGITVLSGSNTGDDDVPESGDFTNLTGGDGIDHTTTPGTLAVDLNATLDGVGDATSLSGLEITATNELALIQGCANNEVLKWVDAGATWDCAADADSGGSPTLDNVSNPAAAKLFAHADTETIGFDSASDGEAFFTISLSAADLAGNTKGLLITAVDNDDVNYQPLTIQDDQDGTPDTLFQITSTGAIVTATPTTLEPSELDRLDGLAGTIVTDATAVTDLEGIGLAIGGATLALDATEIDAVTWSDGANASNAWTFDVSGTDVVMTFGSASVDIVAAIMNAGGFDASGGSITNVNDITLASLTADGTEIVFKSKLVLESLFDIGSIGTFSAADTTPNVSTGIYWKTDTGGVTITNFGGTPVAGQLLYVESAGATVYDCTSSFLDCGSTDITTAAGDVTAWKHDGTNWDLLSYMDVSRDNGVDIDTEAKLETSLGSIDVLVSTEVVTASVVFTAAGLSADGTNCADATEVTIGSWGKMPSIICTDNDASIVTATIPAMGDGWDASTVTVELIYIQDAVDALVLNADASGRCVGDTETPAAYGTEIALDDAAVTGTDAKDSVTSAAITLAGTCAAGDMVQIQVAIDATGTTTAMATLNIIGLKVEYGWTLSGD